MEIKLSGNTALYKQVVEYFRTEIMSGNLKNGYMLPSMNELSAILDISPETVKKAYGILTKEGLLRSSHGKGFFVCGRETSSSRRILLLFDSISPYRQTFLDSLLASIDKACDTTILLHNQSVELLKYYLDRELGHYDYYLVMPHFPLEAKTRAAVVKQLRRIPNNKLIFVDHYYPELMGNYGAVYQDFSQDAGQALQTAVSDLREYGSIDVITLNNSLYGKFIKESISSFCGDNGLKMRSYNEISDKTVQKGSLIILLNSQADRALLDINEVAERKGFVIGKDIKVISYNESPICEIVFGGLTTMSVDFADMGRVCAGMINTGVLSKEHAKFGIVRRKTF